MRRILARTNKRLLDQYFVPERPYRRAMLVSTMANQNRINAVYYRGGTSRGVFLQPKDLPTDKSLWPSIFLKLLGSPDPYRRQLDSVGGAGISSLSKVFVVGPSSRDEADVEYTFFAIGIDNEEVDHSGNCGNLTSAVGPFALEENLVSLGEDVKDEVSQKEVRLFNTNTNKIIRSTFSVLNGAPVVRGDYTIDGVGGSGSRITLDFLNPAGAKTGRLLPTGRVVDKFCGIDTSCVDAANPAVFILAEDLQVDGTLLPDSLTSRPNLLERLEEIRQHAAVAMGICKELKDTPRAIPKVAIVSQPSNHKVLSGQELKAGDVDLVARVLSDRQPHRAIPLTGALCTAVAAQIEGSIVQKCLSNERIRDGTITIGHSSGRIQVSAVKNDEGVIECATVYRTARRIMDGTAYY